MAKSLRALRRDARREHKKKLKRQEIRRAQRAGSLWNEHELIVLIRPLERLGPSTYYCDECGIIEMPHNEDEAPVQGAPSETNWLGVRNDHRS